MTELASTPHATPSAGSPARGAGRRAHFRSRRAPALLSCTRPPSPKSVTFPFRKPVIRFGRRSHMLAAGSRQGDPAATTIFRVSRGITGNRLTAAACSTGYCATAPGDFLSHRSARRARAANHRPNLPCCRRPALSRLTYTGRRCGCGPVRRRKRLFPPSAFHTPPVCFRHAASLLGFDPGCHPHPRPRCLLRRRPPVRPARNHHSPQGESIGCQPLQAPRQAALILLYPTRPTISFVGDNGALWIATNSGIRQVLGRKTRREFAPARPAVSSVPLPSRSGRCPPGRNEWTGRQSRVPGQNRSVRVRGWALGQLGQRSF